MAGIPEPSEGAGAAWMPSEEIADPAKPFEKISYTSVRENVELTVSVSVVVCVLFNVLPDAVVVASSSAHAVSCIRVIQICRLRLAPPGRQVRHAEDAREILGGVR